MQFGMSIPSGRPGRSSRTLLRTLVRVLALAALVLAALPAIGNREAHAVTPLLTTAQRQAYLNYYAPVIFKRGNENNSQAGRDWLTNFDFDQDNNFATNRYHWLESEHYVAASAAQATTSPYATWRIRPTLYTSLIEYMSGTTKSLVLLYHVYNAADKEGSDIHDWERIEIVVRNVTGTPGAVGEYVNNSTITHHHEHIIRKRGDSGFNFMNTSTGRHLMVWQADEAGSSLATHAHELRYVNDTYSSIVSQPVTNDAEVEISGKDENKNVHYIFVPQTSPAAISAWGARAITFANASTLSSGYDNENTINWYQAKRLTYELQDIADIIPTHWSQNLWSTHWLSSASDEVVLESPVVNEAGVTEVSAGRQLFYSKSRDNGASDLTDGREGLIHKRWLYGAYSAEADEDIEGTSDDFPGYQGTGTDSSGWTRQMASGRYDSPNSYWWQHDFFVHDGTVDTGNSTENGQWLRGAWYTAANGGFDGRWVQLFDDRPGLESTIP